MDRERIASLRANAACACVFILGIVSMILIVNRLSGWLRRGCLIPTIIQYRLLMDCNGNFASGCIAIRGFGVWQKSRASLVERMLDLHKQRAAARTPHEQTALDRQITATDARIDRLVYDLYGLTEEEIRLVEG